MTVNIADHGGSIVWEGVYYFALSGWPNISDWELRNLILFFEYEKKHDRTTELVCENEAVLQAANHALANPARYLNTPKPDLLPVPACTNCKQGGCKTNFVCHTTEPQFVEAIFKCGKLLSAVNARNKTGRELSEESRNAAKDTPDYFDFIMFNWGNCFAGDSLVTERRLGGADPREHFCGEKFQPGVRFYFKYDDIANRKDFANDGHHCAKIKHELSLVDYLHCCIIPAAHKTAFAPIAPANLADRVFYVAQDSMDIWAWSDKAFRLAEGLRL